MNITNSDSKKRPVTTKSNSASRNQIKAKSSLGLKEDNTVDTAVLKNSLHEFYKNSKEKLAHCKKEIEVLDSDNERQKEENIKLSLKSINLQNYNEELGIRLKGKKEKLIAAQKRKLDLQTQIRDLKRDVESTSRKIDTMKIDNNYKVKMIQNDINHISNVKENSVKSLKKKIEGEESNQNSLKDKFKEIRGEICKYKALLSELDEQDLMRVKSLHRETAEMTRFLSEI